MAKSKHPSEKVIQTTFFEWLRVTNPHFRALCFSIPNGGKRRLLEAISLKQQGLTAGVPDIFFAYPMFTKQLAGLFIEFKSKLGSLSPEQRGMIARLRDIGYRCEICRSPQEAISAIEDYISHED